jgi:hypothetical protein
MSKIEKRIDVINKGNINARELYAPNCDVTRLVSSLFRSKPGRSLVFEDLLTFSMAGWEIHYTGKKSHKLHLVNAIYEGE